MTFLPEEEIAEFKLAELRLLAQASRDQKTGQQTTIQASGQAFLAADAACKFLGFVSLELQ